MTPSLPLDWVTLEVATAAFAVVAWLAATATGHVGRGNTVAGLRNGLIAGLVLGGAVALFTFAVIGSRSPMSYAIVAGLAVGAGYFLVGAALMPLGFWFGGGSDWARYGTWAAVVVIVFSLGLGYVAFNAFQEKPAASMSSPAPQAIGSAGDASGL